MDEKVQVEFSAKLDDLIRGTHTAKEEIESIKETALGFAEAAGIAFAVDKISEWVEQLVNLNSEMAKTGAILGVTSQEAGNLKAVADISNSSIEGLTFSLSRLALQTATNHDKTSAFGRAMKDLSINTKEFAQLDTNQRLSSLADTFSQLKDGPEKTALGVEVFGRSFLNMLPILNRGSAGIALFAEMSKRAQDDVTPFAEALDRMELQMTELHKSSTGLGLALTGALAPGISAVLDGLTGFTQLITQSYRDTVGWGNAISYLNPVMKEIGRFMIDLGSVFSELGVYVSVVVQEMGNDFNFLKNIWVEESQVMVETNVALGEAFAALGRLIPDAFSEGVSSAISFLNALVQAAKASVTSIGNGFADLGNAMADAMSGDLSGASAALGKMQSDFANVGTELSDGWKNAVNGIDLSKTSSDLADIQSSVTKVNDALSSKSGIGGDLVGDYANVQDKNSKLEELANKTIEANKKNAQEMVDKLYNPDALPEAIKQTQNAHVTPAPNPAKKPKSADLGVYDGEIQALQHALSRKRELLDYELEHHQITMDQYVAQTQQALNEEYRAEIAVYQKELQAKNLTASQKQGILNKEKLAHEKLMDEMLKLELKTADATSKKWTDVASKISNAFGSALKGMVTGTTTPLQAMWNILDQFANDAIDAALKMLENWVLAETSKTAATSAGSTARTGIAAGEAAAGQAVSVGSAIQSIIRSGGEAFAGVAAFLAPLLGPASLGPAAATQATVTSVGLASVYDTGAWSISHDQVAGVHKGEMIIPQRGGIADEFRAMMSGGGIRGMMKSQNKQNMSDVHLHVHALDAKSFQGYIQKHGRSLASVVRNQMNSNPSLQPSY